MTTISLDKLKELVELQRPGYTLDQQFYTDPDIFEIDLNTFFLPLTVSTNPSGNGRLRSVRRTITSLIS